MFRFLTGFFFEIDLYCSSFIVPLMGRLLPTPGEQKQPTDHGRAATKFHSWVGIIWGKRLEFSLPNVSGGVFVKKYNMRGGRP